MNVEQKIEQTVAVVCMVIEMAVMKVSMIYILVVTVEYRLIVKLCCPCSSGSLIVTVNCILNKLTSNIVL